ncbi:hypothetical protein [Acinetobacter sp. ANC 4973]|uniref:hypothetical protein n=1 Tax=Acinetobacter sp. ANC 4973 TaxID=1977871 RepID=UPI000A330807|nr:hypothetical protein [Acinetobacter sp. ANC 4973]OTG99524.1 hypothetical protein B9T30_08520 [Acinetobacter sp. ANC 4973]
MKIKLLILVFLPFTTFAESKFDIELLNIGVVDSSYKIIDYKTFDEILRLSSQQISPMLPMKVDSVTTALSFNLNRFGIYSIYQIDNVETEREAEFLIEKQKIGEFYRNYMCSLDYSKSLTFKRNGDMAANMSVVNSKYQVLYKIRVPFKECI